MRTAIIIAVYIVALACDPHLSIPWFIYLGTALTALLDLMEVSSAASKKDGDSIKWLGKN